MADNRGPDRAAAWTESRADTRWLSYDDLVEITGIKRESVLRMVRRKKWPKRMGNEPGSVRVAVPVDVIEILQARRDARPPVIEAAALAPWLNRAEIAQVIRKLVAALAEIRSERDDLRLELERERAAAKLVQAWGEGQATAAAEAHTRAAEQRARLNEQVGALAAKLEWERAATQLARALGERNEAAAVEERVRADDQCERLNAQVGTLAAESARLHAASRVAVLEQPAASAPLLGRMTSLTRWLRS